MGCFNRTGFYSKISVARGQESFVLLAVAGREGRVTPIGPPIFGDYNEYGTLENIKENNYTKAVAELFGVPSIENVIDAFDDIEVGRDNEYADQVLAKLRELTKNASHPYPPESIDIEPLLLLDHKVVWEELLAGKERYLQSWEGQYVRGENAITPGNLERSIGYQHYGGEMLASHGPYLDLTLKERDIRLQCLPELVEYVKVVNQVASLFRRFERSDIGGQCTGTYYKESQILHEKLGQIMKEWFDNWGEDEED